MPPQRLSAPIENRKEKVLILKMNKIFEEMFVEQADEIIGGDYFYRTWYEEFTDILKIPSSESPLTYLYEWNQRTLQGKRAGLNKSPWILRIYKGIDSGLRRICEVFDKIAVEGKPFMDICSSNSWGLIPFIVKINPDIPCMATDIAPHSIKRLRIFIERKLTEYNISLASFDNHNIPVKNNSLDYITSSFGISSSVSENVLNDIKAQNNLSRLSMSKEKPISEVYRILKPGGCFVTIEKNIKWAFDLLKAREAYNRRGNLFGKYDYNEIGELQDKLKMISWRDLFESAGFQVEIEEKYPLQKVRKNLLYRFLYDNSLKAYEWSDEENKWYKEYFSSPNKKDFDEEAGDYGIEFAEGEILYVLRKSD